MLKQINRALANLRYAKALQLQAHIKEKTGLDTKIIEGKNTTAVIPEDDKAARQEEFKGESAGTWRKLQSKFVK